MKILDCTFRDGGYYTNWDFNRQTVDAYLKAVNKLPIDYIEIGYRNLPEKSYMGEYDYCPEYAVRHIRQNTSKKIAVMLNEKSTKLKDLPVLLDPMKGLADMVRVSIPPQHIDQAIELAKGIKDMGFEVGFNVMYMSTWKSVNFYPKLKALNGIADLFCMVDSFGGVTPTDVKNTISALRSSFDCPIGFHGHNNLEMSLFNTLTAMECGVDYVDATILGMGRGAGNLKMELLLTYLNKNCGLDVDFNVLGDVISAFTPLYEKYRWGTNLPYMLAGANSFPQKEVMAMVTNRLYSFNSIVRCLQNRKENIEDNARFPLLPMAKRYKSAFIIGGGSSVITHEEGIKNLICKEGNDTLLVFASSRNASPYSDILTDKIYCLVGNESSRLTRTVGEIHSNDLCVLPPYPRVMGTDVDDRYKAQTFELDEITFTEKYNDSCTAVALQTAMSLADNIFVLGYDGYPEGFASEKERELTIENRAIFDDATKKIGVKLPSLTPTLYEELGSDSLYKYLI